MPNNLMKMWKELWSMI